MRLLFQRQIISGCNGQVVGSDEANADWKRSTKVRGEKQISNLVNDQRGKRPKNEKVALFGVGTQHTKQEIKDENDENSMFVYC